MRKLLTVGLVLVSSVMTAAGPAAAHAGLMPGDLAPGTTVESEVVIVHGCGPNGTIPANDDETSPTTTVTVTRPDGLTFTPREAAGWTLTTETDADGELRSARWQYDEPAGTLEPVFLGVEVTADADLGTTDVYVPVVQDCADGEQLAWVNEQPQEQEGRLPAMLVTVDPEAAAARPTPGGGLPTPVIVSLAIALGIAAGGAVMMLSMRRH